MRLTFLVYPGGSTAQQQRELFEQLPPQQQEQLASLTAVERSHTLGCIAFAQLAGQTTSADPSPNPTGSSSKMWGNQRGG